MATATVNGIDLYYREAGSGQPLLLVHGAGFNADEPPLYAIRNISFPVLITFAKIFFLKAVGRPQAAAKTFARMVLAYSDGRNSYESLPPELRAGLARDSRTLLAELAAGTGEELNPEILPTLNAPVTLLFGELSHLSLRQAMDRLARIFPLAPLVRLPGANHLAQVDRPQAFVRAVSGVLALEYAVDSPGSEAN